MSKASLSRKDFFKLAGGALGIGALAYLFGLRDQPNTPSSEAAPDYRDGGLGFPVFRGPYLQKNAQLAALLFPAELSALTALCDQSLNAAPPGPFTYLPLIPNVLLVYAEMLVASLDERDVQVGLIPETELSFWLLTVAMQRTSLGLVPHHLAWFIPSLLVDEANAIATGREVYGFNKQAGRFTKPAQIQSPSVQLDVLGFQTFGPEAVARPERLLELQAPAAATASQWSDWETAQKALTGPLLAQTRTDLGAGMVAFAAQAALSHIPLVFLKQFRHAAEPRTACYQAIVEAPLKLQAFYGGAFFKPELTLGVNSLASHPLASQLGLAARQTASAGAWLQVDFVLGLGTEHRLA